MGYSWLLCCYELVTNLENAFRPLLPCSLLLFTQYDQTGSELLKHQFSGVKYQSVKYWQGVTFIQLHVLCDRL